MSGMPELVERARGGGRDPRLALHAEIRRLLEGGLGAAEGVREPTSVVYEPTCEAVEASHRLRKSG